MAEGLNTDVIEFDAASHRYFRRDSQRTEIPGVTSVISPVIGQDFSMVDPEKLEAAARLGTAVHDLIRRDILTGLKEDGYDLCDDFAHVGYFEAWREFIFTSGFRPLYSERMVYSEKYGYAGQLDLLGVLNGRLMLPDIKRVNTVSRTAGPQTAAYKQAASETLGEQLALMMPELGVSTLQIDRCVLHLRPGSRWQLVPFNDNSDMKVFLSALTIHHWKQKAL